MAHFETGETKWGGETAAPKDDHSYNTAYHTKRIADTLEEILRLVKQDMERMKKLND